MFTLHLFKKKKKCLVAARSCCILSDEFNQKYRSKRACDAMQRVSCCEKTTVQMWVRAARWEVWSLHFREFMCNILPNIYMIVTPWMKSLQPDTSCKMPVTPKVCTFRSGWGWNCRTLKKERRKSLMWAHPRILGPVSFWHVFIFIYFYYN